MKRIYVALLCKQRERKVQDFGKCTYLLSFKKYNEEIDGTLIKLPLAAN